MPSRSPFSKGHVEFGISAIVDDDTYNQLMKIANGMVDDMVAGLVLDLLARQSTQLAPGKYVGVSLRRTIDGQTLDLEGLLYVDCQFDGRAGQRLLKEFLENVAREAGCTEGPVQHSEASLWEEDLSVLLTMEYIASATTGPHLHFKTPEPPNHPGYAVAMGDDDRWGRRNDI